MATARRPETLEDLDVAQTLALDVDDPASIEVRQGAAGDVDVLVNNAGWRSPVPSSGFHSTRCAACSRPTTSAWCGSSKPSCPACESVGGGVIVNVSSVAGRVVGPSVPLRGDQVRRRGIVGGPAPRDGPLRDRVVVIEPGFIGTAFSDNVRRYGEDEAPYDELRDQWEASSASSAPTTVPALRSQPVRSPTPYRTPAPPSGYPWRRRDGAGDAGRHRRRDVRRHAAGAGPHLVVRPRLPDCRREARIVSAVQRRLVNPLVRFAARHRILRRPTPCSRRPGEVGKLRVNPVGNRLSDDRRTFWLVAEQGGAAQYVRNLLADPRVRVRARGQWYDGRAQVLPDDDPVARLKKIGHTVNGWFVGRWAPTCSPSASTSTRPSRSPPTQPPGAPGGTSPTGTRMTLRRWPR